MRWREEEQVIGSEASQRRNGNHDARWNVGGVVMEECGCEQKNVVGGRGRARGPWAEQVRDCFARRSTQPSTFLPVFYGFENAARTLAS